MTERGRRNCNDGRRQQSLSMNSTNNKYHLHEEREDMDFLDAVSTREDAVLQMRPREGPTPLQQCCKLLQAIARDCQAIDVFVLWSWVSADCSRSG